MPKLNDTQLMILSAAAQRDDSVVLPLPKSLKSDDKAASAALKRLLKAGLLVERPATRDGASWREDEDGQRLTLAITDAGRQVLGDDDAAQGEVVEAAALTAATKKTRAKKPSPKSGAGKSPAKAAKSRKGKAAPPAASRQGTKQQVLIELLRRADGATIEEAVEATGWQAHSVRGAISGSLKKKLGLEVTSEKVEGRGRVYRISDER